MYFRRMALPIFVLLLLQAGFAQNISREAPIVAGEYFIGQDPGQGKGTQILINNPAAKMDVPIPNISLQAGQKLYVRFKNKNGYWTAPRGITYNGAGVQRSINITQAEYFIGIDPGRGKGKPIPIMPAMIVNLTPSLLSLQKGQRLSIRVKDAENRWSAPRAIAYSGVGNNRGALIAYAEYFIGVDPGREKGKPIPITPAMTVNLNPPALSLQKGQKVFFRIRDTENRWSDPAAIAYNDYGLKRDALIAFAEYFIGNDPGRGKGIKININPADSLSIKLPTVALMKAQKLYLRVQDSQKRWGDPVAFSYPPRYIRRAEIVVAKDPSKVEFGKGLPMIAEDGVWGSAYEAIRGMLPSWNQKDSIWVRVQSSEYIWSKPIGDFPTTNKFPSVSAATQFKAGGTIAISEGGMTNENKVVFKATVSDPDGEQVKLQIELRKIAEVFTGTPTLQSSLVNSGMQVTIARDSLLFASYKWRCRAVDARGLAGDWKEFGGAGNIDFTVNVNPEIPIFPVVASPQVSGREFGLEVQVGDAANQVSNLFGVSFVLNFTPTDYIDVVAPPSSNIIAGSFMGNDVVLYQTVNETSGKVNVGISRKVGQGGVNNNGVVLRVKFVARANTPDNAKVQFSITDVKANDPQGNPIKLIPRSKLVTINNKNIIVWPGDTNNDGVVNQADVLPIGLFWGAKGPARPNVSMNWIGQPGPPWTPVAATYANANGDTIVNQAEVPAIGLNWGKSHTTPPLLAHREMQNVQTPASATIVPEAIPAEQAPNHEFVVQIKVTTVSKLFGLAFDLVYDRPQLVQGLAVAPDSMLGPDVVFYSNVDTSNGKIAVGISRKAGQSGVSGNGSVVRVKAKVAANATAGAKITLVLQNIAANDDRGSALNLNPQSSRLIVRGTTSADSKGNISLPASYRLYPNHPNPFHAGTLLRYEIPRIGQVVVKVYNSAGQEVRTLENAVRQPGYYQIHWNGLDEQGRAVPSGLYTCRLQAGSFVQSHKMLMVR